MAGALIEGLLASKSCRPAQIIASDVRSERLEDLNRLGIQTTRDNREATARGDIIVLSTKPNVFPDILPEIAPGIRPKNLVISIAAGVRLSVLQSQLPEGARIVRAMPNTPALARSGATGLAAGAHATADDMKLAEQLFSCVGVTVSVEEYLLDAVTGLSGSGPAYVFVIIEAMADAGVEMGLSRQTAYVLAVHTVLGSAKLLLETGEHPARLKDNVASPGGTTIAGLQQLEAAGIRKALGDAVRSATHQSKMLGEQTAAKFTQRS